MTTKIIASSSLDLKISDREFSKTESGLWVLPGGYVDRVDLTPYIRAAQELPLTIIATTKINEGRNYTYMIKGDSYRVVDVFFKPDFYELEPNKKKEISAIAKAAVAAGADGLLIEVHPNPEQALVDGLQSLTPKKFAKLMKELKAIAESVGRTI